MSLINKTAVSLEEKLKKAENEYNSSMIHLDNVEKKVEELKNEGRINDAIFAAKIATVFSSECNYLHACIVELKESIATGVEDTAYGLSYVTKEIIRQGFAQLVVEDYQLYNQIVGCKIVEEDLITIKKFAEGKK